MIKEIKAIEWTFENTSNVIIIVKSNWDGWFHVIEEDREQGDLWHKHELMSKDVLRNMYCIDIDEYFGG